MSISKLKDKLQRKVFGAPHSYIEALLNPSLGWDVRDDYAAYLIEYDEPEVEDALLRVAANPDEKDDIAESCGEGWPRFGVATVR